MRPHPLAALGALLLDAFFLALALALALLFRFGAEIPADEAARAAGLLPLVLLAQGVTLFGAGIYAKDWTRFRGEDLLAVLRALALGGVLLIAFAFFARLLAASRYVLVAQGILAAALLLLWRGAVGSLAQALRRRGLGLSDAVVVGGETEAFARRLEEGEGYRVRRLSGREVLADSSCVREGERVFVVEPDFARATVIVAGLSGRPGVSVLWVPTSLELLTLGAETYEIAGRPVLNLGVHGGRYYLPSKRAFDLLLAVLLIPVAVIFIALASMLVRMTSPGPIFFRQERVGRDGRVFSIWKIRTMEAGAAPPTGAGPGETVRDDPRVTGVGRFLRRFSFDEWPQVANILRGEMSFIGPRPEVPEVVRTYTAWERRILEAPPGLTGLVQVSGRDDLSPEEKRRLDLFYLRHRTFALDLVILFRTLAAVLLSPGRA